MAETRPSRRAFERTCVHEAGHATASCFLQVPLRYASVESDFFHAGQVAHARLTKQQQTRIALAHDWYVDDLALRRLVEKQIVVCLAGNEAELALLGSKPRRRRKKDPCNPAEVSDEEFAGLMAVLEEKGVPPPDDEEQALTSARLVCETDAEARALVEYLRQRTRRLVRDRYFQAGARAVADELSRHPRIGARRVRGLVREAREAEGERIRTERLKERSEP